MPAAGVPATFRTSTAPLYRRYIGLAGTGSGAIPTLDELIELSQHLQSLRQDVEARARTLAEERRSSGPQNPKKQQRETQVKREEDFSLDHVRATGSRKTESEPEGADWSSAGDMRARGNINRTYGRAGHRRRNGLGRQDASGSDADSDLESDIPLNAMQAKSRSQPKTEALPSDTQSHPLPQQQPSLGIKLRLTNPEDALRLRSDSSRSTHTSASKHGSDVVSDPSPDAIGKKDSAVTTGAMMLKATPGIGADASSAALPASMTGSTSEFGEGTESILNMHGDTFHDPTTFSWDAPADMASCVMPKREPIREIRPYPTHPYDVHEDFANTDWHDRESMYSVGKAAGTPAAMATAENSTMALSGDASTPQPPVKDTSNRSRSTKEAAQVPATTFFNYVDAFFKPITEDDLAWLSSRADDPSPYVFPELGLHYRKVWEKEDAELQSVLKAMDDSLSSSSTPAPHAPPTNATEAGNTAATSKDSTSVTDAATVPSSLAIEDLVDANMYDRVTRGGPLMERLVSSLMVPENPTSKAATASSVTEVTPTAEASSAAAMEEERPPPDVHQSFAEMESRTRRACESIGLVEAGVPIQWEEHGDSLIASMLRLAQERLRRQSKMNEERKASLFKVAKDRMAYQDYQACLQAVEREIEANWTKRMRQIKASAGKKRKHDAEAGPVRPQLAETLPDALQRRKKLKAVFEPLFAKIPHACKPPTQSIYQSGEKESSQD